MISRKQSLDMDVDRQAEIKRTIDHLLVLLNRKPTSSWAYFAQIQARNSVAAARDHMAVAAEYTDLELQVLEGEDA